MYTLLDWFSYHAIYHYIGDCHYLYTYNTVISDLEDGGYVCVLDLVIPVVPRSVLDVLVEVVVHGTLLGHKHVPLNLQVLGSGMNMV